MGPTVFLVIFISLSSTVHSMIVTSVFAGPKKFKSASFDLLPFPLVWSSPNKWQFAYRGHYTFRRPYFNVNMATPVSLPFNFVPPPPKYSPTEPEYASPSEEHGDLVDEIDADDSVPPDQKKKYNGYEIQDQKSPRPYTGKAQVSSFIDNGQFVNANTGIPNPKLQDAAFGDEPDKTYQRMSDDFLHTFPQEHISRRVGLKKKGKTVAMGYDVLGEMNKPNLIKIHNLHPDSMPWGMDYDGWQKYYTTFQFTDAFRDPRTYVSLESKSPLLQKVLALG